VKPRKPKSRKVEKPRMSMGGFVPLHFHTEYSLLDGVGKLHSAVEQCAKYGCRTLAITDHGTTSGWFQFAKACEECEVKPIFGVELDVCGDNDVGDKREFPRRHVVLLAMTQSGYLNLMKLVTKAWQHEYNGRPRANYKLLRQHSKGLVCLTGCVEGPLSAEILSQSGREEHELERLVSVYGQRNVYLELQSLELEDVERANLRLVELSGLYEIEPVITNNVHYIEPGEDKYRIALHAMAEKQKTVADLEREAAQGDNPRPQHCYLKGMREQRRTFREFNPNVPSEVVERALENTKIIGDRAKASFKKFKNLMPTVKVPRKYRGDDGQYLRDLTYRFDLEPFIAKTRAKWRAKMEVARGKQEKDRWRSKLRGLRKEYAERIESELELMISHDYAGYFILVYRIYQFAEKKGIASGPGRGSVCGSLVALCLGLTHIDPIFHDLLFERFLNVHRHDLPDIDMDFDDRRRDEVKRYLETSYDSRCVATIANFTTLSEKAILDDLQRALGEPSKAVVETMKDNLVTKEAGESDILKESLKRVPELKRMAKQYPKFFEYAVKLEGQIRHLGVHAAGVIVTPKPLWNYLSIERNVKKDIAITSYPGELCESLGLVKLDILGVSTIGEIDQAEDMIGDRFGWVDLDFEDQDVLAHYRDGDTTGVFQFECVSGSTRILGGTTVEEMFDRGRPMEGISGKTRRVLSPVTSLKIPVSPETVDVEALVHFVGEKSCVCLQTDDGSEIEVAEDHVFFTPDGREIRLADLKKGDEVLVVTDDRKSD